VFDRNAVILAATVPMTAFVGYIASAGTPYKISGPLVVLGAAVLVSVVIGGYRQRQGALVRAWFATIAVLALIAGLYGGMALLAPTVCHPWSTASVCSQATY
jgi:hypothetical protein